MIMKNINALVIDKKTSIVIFLACLFLIILANSFSEEYIILGDEILKKNDYLKGMEVTKMFVFFGIKIPLKKFIAFISFYIFISIYLFLFKNDSQIKKMFLDNKLIKFLLELYK
jgi:hypothetical protein